MKKGQSFIGSNEFEDYSSMKESRLSIEEEQQLIKKDTPYINDIFLCHRREKLRLA